MTRNENIYKDLFLEWCEGLYANLIKVNGTIEEDGGFFCPSCRRVHGRDDNAIYAFMLASEITGEKKYLEAAKFLFDKHKNNCCPDGSLINGGSSVWNGITVFSALLLLLSIEDFGHLLTKEEKTAWEERARAMCEWLHGHIDTGYPANINYRAGNAACMIVAGQYFGEEKYLTLADALFENMMAHLTENGLIYGEGFPVDLTTPKGCRAVDIGYNWEETVPLLTVYAQRKGSPEAREKMLEVMRSHLWFINPDGSVENSFGSRSYKWSYWGSRTADGCSEAYAVFGKDSDPAFAEAAYRNTLLMKKCTFGKLLAGGMQYDKYGEKPCIHHTFCHATGLAQAVKHGVKAPAEKTLLPIEELEGYKYFPELDTYRIHSNGYTATVTGYDVDHQKGHATGGTLTYLYSEKDGVILLSSLVDYRAVEAGNMQISLTHPTRGTSLTPRAEVMVDESKPHNPKIVRYSPVHDPAAKLEAKEEDGKVIIKATAQFLSQTGAPLAEPLFATTVHTFGKEGYTCETTLSRPCKEARYVLPMISETATFETDSEVSEPETVFNLTAGFGAKAYKLTFKEDGTVKYVIK